MEKTLGDDECEYESEGVSVSVFVVVVVWYDMIFVCNRK